MEKTCVILANGSFPESEKALCLLRSADYLCCCDGAIERLAAIGITPDVIIGDGDSIPPHLRDRFAGIFIHVEEQEYNDLTKATRHCAALGYRRITYLGATGRREDHTIGNIFLLPFYLRELGVQPTMLTDHGVFTAHEGDTLHDTFPGQQVSIFNISCTRLEGSRLRYPLSPFTQLWQGTLNEALAATFSISADGEYIVFKSLLP